jgi:hypothetical protein
MSARNRGWNLSFEHKTDLPREETASDTDHADRWIWGVWIVVALISVAILPFSSRFHAVARTIAQLCGFEL